MASRKFSGFGPSLFLFFIQTGLTSAAILEIVSIAGAAPNERIVYCVQYNYQFQQLPHSSQDAAVYDLVDLSAIEGCNSSDYDGHNISLNSPMVAVMRGDCGFTQKASVAQAHGAVASLIVDYKNSSYVPIPGGNKTDFDTINISLAVISWNDFSDMVSHGAQVKVKLYDQQMPKWNNNMIFIILASTAMVMVGGIWAAYSEVHILKARFASRASKSKDGESDSDNKDEEADPFTVLGVIIWFCFICGTILLLYFFYDYLVYVFIAIFCIVGAHALYRCLLPAWTFIMPINYDIPLNKLPCFKSKAKLGSLLLLMPCVTLAIFWAIERHASYAWIIQDVLGIAFCVHLIQSMRLPSLKVIAILLTLLLVYDVFFVFITPLFTSDGESVMVSVATGGGGQSKESLPMVFIIPLFGSSATVICRERNYSLLGFGDVIVPGILVAYNAISDVRLGTRNRQLQRKFWFHRMPYFTTAVVGYLVGMVICMVSLVLMETGQPALLFLVPCTLVPTIALALFRHQFALLFRGDTLLMVQSPDMEEAQVGDRVERPTDNGLSGRGGGIQDTDEEEDAHVDLRTHESSEERINLIG